MRPSFEFTVNGKFYRASPMDALGQMHVVRRLTPILVGAIPALVAFTKQRQAAAEDGKAVGADAAAAILPSLEAAAHKLAQMPDAEFEDVQSRCLALVERQRPGETGWARIWNVQARSPQFADIEGHELLLIMVEVLRAEIGPFLQGMVTDMTASAPPETTSR